MTALMTVAETEEAEEAMSDSAVAAAAAFTRPSLDLRSFSMKQIRSGLSEPGDMLEPARRRRTGPQLLQLSAERYDHKFDGHMTALVCHSSACLKCTCDTSKRKGIVRKA